MKQKNRQGKRASEKKSKPRGGPRYINSDETWGKSCPMVGTPGEGRDSEIDGIDGIDLFDTEIPSNEDQEVTITEGLVRIPYPEEDEVDHQAEVGCIFDRKDFTDNEN